VNMRACLENTGTIFAIVAAIALTVASSAIGQDEFPEVDSVLGMDSTGGAAWLAVRIDVPEGMALSGLAWYNNDEDTVFDRICVGTGYETNPGVVSEFVQVAENIQGLSSGWSNLVFQFPVKPSLSSLYVAFSLPADELLSARGLGGGPGMGVFAGEGGVRGWLSGEGEVWAYLHEDHRFAVLPVLVEATDDMAVKSLGGDEDDELAVGEPYLAVGPNPFNPAVEILFGLNSSADLRLSVYDLRGRLMRRLVCEHRAAGAHSVTWKGTDGSGRRVASGVYLVRLEAGDVQFTRRITMVK